MRKKWLIFGTAVLLAIGATQMGYAQQGSVFGNGFGFGPGVGPGIMARAEALDLKPEQVTKIKAMRLELAKATLQLRNELQLKQLELRQMMLADKPDQGLIGAKIDEVAPLRTELQKKRIEYLLAIRGILTPEQKSKLDLWQGIGERRHGGRRGWHRSKG